MGLNWRCVNRVRLGGAAASLKSDTFDPCNLLQAVVRIAGYAGSSIAQLQFNGDAGTTAYAYSVSDNFAVPTTGVAAAAAGLKVSQTATTSPRALINFFIRNVNGDPHGVTWEGSDLSESAATAPSIILGAGIWTTTSQITQITLDGGGANLLTGTELAIYALDG